MNPPTVRVFSYCKSGLNALAQVACLRLRSFVETLCREYKVSSRTDLDAKQQGVQAAENWVRD
mgnify:CR=1 FL=1